MMESSTTAAKSMGNKRDELYLNLTVPSLFRCPISMDVMKSPVSLCTGVTYDRSSIQTWLSQGHNTCPATMQVLPSTDFTPNLTLRSLINHYLHQQPVPASPSHSILSRDEASDLIRKLRVGAATTSVSVDSLSKVLDFVRFSEENRRFIASSDGVVLDILGILRSSQKIEACEQIVLILNQVLLENGVKKQLTRNIHHGDFDYLSKFVFIFRRGSLSSRISSAKILESIAVDSDSQRKISEKKGLMMELYKLIDEESDKYAVEAGLSALISISTSKMAKKEIVRFGIVRTVRKILSGSETARQVTEKALEILVAISTCTDGRGAIIEDEECIMAVVKKLMKCSPAATEHGVTMLWSLCCLARDRTAQEAVMKVNGLTKVLLVMQSNCSAGVRQRCGDLVKVLRVKNSKSCLASYETKTTHIMPY